MILKIRGVKNVHYIKTRSASSEGSVRLDQGHGGEAHGPSSTAPEEMAKPEGGGEKKLSRTRLNKL